MICNWSSACPNLTVTQKAQTESLVSLVSCAMKLDERRMMTGGDRVTRDMIMHEQPSYLAAAVHVQAWTDP